MKSTNNPIERDLLSPTMAFSPSGAMINPPARPQLSTNLPAAARSIKVVEVQERTTSGPNYYKIKRVIYIPCLRARARLCVSVEDLYGIIRC